MIIDFGIGLPGSQHDATAWKKTRLPQEHEQLLGEGKWIWADSAYPIQPWLVAPYKKYVLIEFMGFILNKVNDFFIRPEKYTAENEQFNYHVSAVRIRSEHCVGFWKGRFPSLRGLRLEINNSKQLLFATYWVIATIAIHNFAIQHETSDNFHLDIFLRDGLRDLEEDQPHMAADRLVAENEASEEELARADNRDIELIQAKIKREELKAALFEFLGEN